MIADMISRRQSLRRVAGTGLCVALPAWSARAWSATFMDIDQARRLLLPLATRFGPVPLALDAAARARIAELSQTRVPRGYAPECWRAWQGEAPGGWVLLDRTLGKYELIDFAAGFAPDGTITGMEILAYRESHGAEIRQPAWRRQFNGRRGPEHIRFEDDIRNISGATLSSQHVTEAMQRLAAIVQTQLVTSGH